MEHLPAPRPSRRPEDLEPVVKETILAPRGAAAPYPSSTAYVEHDEDGSADEFNTWLRYGRVLARHKLALFVAAITGTLLGLALSMFQTPIYVASTTLEFSQGAQPQPMDGLSVATEDPYLLQTQVALLSSRTLLDRAVRRLANQPPDIGQAAGPIESVKSWFGVKLTPLPSSAWEDAIGYARGALLVTPVRDTRIVRVVSESTLPQAAAAYANTVAEEFIEQNLEERWAAYQTTGVWLDRAQAELKKKLEDSETQLLAYASESGLVVTSKHENIAEQKLVDMQAELSKGQAERIAKEAIYRTAMSRPADSIAELLDRGPMADYEVKLAELRRQLADASTALTAAHPKVKRLQAQIDELHAAQGRERGNVLSRMRGEYETALQRERQLLADFTNQSKVLSAQDQKLIRYKMLQREVETYRTLYETTLQKGKEASLASALRPVTARLVDVARPPRAPSKPNLPLNLAFGFAAGLIVGAALLLFRERADFSIREPGFIALHVNLRELGVIPSATLDSELSIEGARKPQRLLTAGSRRRDREASGAPHGVELATWNRKSSLVAESFRATVTSILMSGQSGHRKQIILVTSPSPREGKSTVVTNLAVALAEISQRVLLIDADLRRPRLHTIFGQVNTWGLSDILRDATPCGEFQKEMLGRKTHVPGVFALPSGPGGVSAARLLYSDRTAELLDRLRQEFDTILIDTPPVLSVADARILSRLADAVVLVIRAGHTTREAAMMAVNVFDADGVPILGTVLNDWNPQTMGSGYYPSDYLDHYRDVSNG